MPKGTQNLLYGLSSPSCHLLWVLAETTFLEAAFHKLEAYALTEKGINPVLNSCLLNIMMPLK